MWQIDVQKGARPIGYRYLIEQHQIEIFAVIRALKYNLKDANGGVNHTDLLNVCSSV